MNREVNNRTYYIGDPRFSEYVYHIMATASEKKKGELDHQELRFFKDDKTMFRFANLENMDRIFLMLTRLGVKFSILVYEEAETLDRVFKQAGKQYNKAETRFELIKYMQENNIFVFGSMDLLMVSHMAAQNSHSQVLRLNIDFVRQQQKIVDISKDNISLGIEEALKGFDSISKTILHALTSLKNIVPICGVNDSEMEVLLALYPYRNTFVSRSKLSDMISTRHLERGVGRICGSLVKRGYLAREPGHNNQQNEKQNFTILEKGVNAAMAYMKYCLNHLR